MHTNLEKLAPRVEGQQTSQINDVDISGGLAGVTQSRRVAKPVSSGPIDRMQIQISDDAFTRAIRHAHKMAIEADNARSPGLVYFIAPMVGGPVKIGFSLAIEQRLPALQAYCPLELDLIGCAPGARDLESHYHALFSNERLHGEWFTPTDRLLGECQRLSSLWIG